MDMSCSHYAGRHLTHSLGHFQHFKGKKDNSECDYFMMTQTSSFAILPSTMVL